MTSSFSQYANKYLLSGRLAPNASLASSQPLFYSFQDSSDGESSTGRGKPPQQSRDELELDEHGEPRLRGDEEVDDPYLRLDEDDGDHTLKESAPLIASEAPSTQGGWLAHQTSPLPSRSPTPTSPESPESPPPHLIEPRPPTRTTLTESLLPRDGVSRSVFSLPVPGRIPRHKYNDASWTVLWCTSLTVCFLAFIFVLFLTQARHCLIVRLPNPHSAHAVLLLPHTLLHPHAYHPPTHQPHDPLHIPLLHSHSPPSLLCPPRPPCDRCLHPRLPHPLRPLCFLRLLHLRRPPQTYHMGRDHRPPPLLPHAAHHRSPHGPHPPNPHTSD
jgi:hypothetical protein